MALVRYPQRASGLGQHWADTLPVPPGLPMQPPLPCLPPAPSKVAWKHFHVCSRCGPASSVAQRLSRRGQKAPGVPGGEGQGVGTDYHRRQFLGQGIRSGRTLNLPVLLSH